MQEIVVTVSVAKLTEIIQANRDAHRAIFEKALDRYREAVIEELEKRIASVRRGNAIDKSIRLPEPEDHTEDYDRVLQMLAMHQFPDITIGSEDFAMFVRDDWSWKRQWTTTNSTYGL